MIPEGPAAASRSTSAPAGPGHIDPHQNDGERDGSQGIEEDPAWERPLFELFDAIRDGRGRRARLRVPHASA